MPHPLTSLSIPPSFPPLISPLWRPLLSLPITTLFPPSPYLPRLSPPRSFNPSICFVCPSIRLSPLQALLFRMCRLNTWHGVLKSVHVCVCVCECVWVCVWGRATQLSHWICVFQASRRPSVVLSDNRWSLYSFTAFPEQNMKPGTKMWHRLAFIDFSDKTETASVCLFRQQIRPVYIFRSERWSRVMLLNLRYKVIFFNITQDRVT